MDFKTVRAIMDKEFSMFRARPIIFFPLIIAPFAIGIVIAVFLDLIWSNTNILTLGKITELNSMTTIFAGMAAIIAAMIASYSIVGERVQKSLEPLLGSPVRTGSCCWEKSPLHSSRQ